MKITQSTDRRLFAGNTVQPTVEIKQTENLIKDNCLMLKLVISGLSFQKKVNSDQVIDDTIDAKLMSVTKSLISKDYLSKITSLDSSTRTAITNLGFRPSFIHSGFVLIPRTAVRYAEDLLKQFKDERERLVKQLADSIELAKFDAIGRLGSLYNEHEYPSASEIIAKFKVQHEYLSTKIDSELEEIDAQAFLEQQRIAEEKWSGAFKEVVDIQISQFYELVDSMLEKVTGLNDGKIFKQGFVEKMRTFLETFDLMNVTNNEKLKAQVQKARDVLDGETPDSMRNREDVRIRIEQTFSTIKSSLDDMMTDEGREVDF